MVVSVLTILGTFAKRNHRVISVYGNFHCFARVLIIITEIILICYSFISMIVYLSKVYGIKGLFLDVYLYIMVAFVAFELYTILWTVWLKKAYNMIER